MIVYTSFFTRGVGWHVFDMNARRKVAGPFKGRGARETCIAEEMRLRRIEHEKRERTAP